MSLQKYKQGYLHPDWENDYTSNFNELFWILFEQEPIEEGVYKIFHKQIEYFKKIGKSEEGARKFFTDNNIFRFYYVSDLPYEACYATVDLEEGVIEFLDSETIEKVKIL